jgi:hypothetical protein
MAIAAVTIELRLYMLKLQESKFFIAAHKKKNGNKAIFAKIKMEEFSVIVSLLMTWLHIPPFLVFAVK